jgi:hypothetical protein
MNHLTSDDRCSSARYIDTDECELSDRKSGLKDANSYVPPLIEAPAMSELFVRR